MKATQEEEAQVLCEKENATFGQATQVLTLVNSQKPTVRAVQDLFSHGWIFRHLFDRDTSQPIDEFEFCKAVGAPIFEKAWTDREFVDITIDYQTPVIEQIREYNEPMALAMEKGELRYMQSGNSPWWPTNSHPTKICLIRPTGKFPWDKFRAYIKEEHNLFPVENILAFLALVRQLDFFTKGMIVMVAAIILKGGRWFHLYKDLSNLSEPFDFCDAFFDKGYCDPSMIFPVVAYYKE